jgi:predicted amidohydrolase
VTRDVTLAAAQFACSWEIEANLETAERLVREAAGRGAQIVLLQELFQTRTSASRRIRGTSTWRDRRRTTPPWRASAA